MPTTRLLVANAQQSTPTSWLIILAAAFFLVALGGYCVNRAVRRRRLGSHLHLFAELCRAHRLEALEIGTLRRVAAKHGLARPGDLFVNPRWLDSLIENPEGDFRPKSLAALRRKLFSGKATEEDLDGIVEEPENLDLAQEPFGT